MKTSPFDRFSLYAIQDTINAKPKVPFNYNFFFRLFGLSPLLVLAFGYLAPIIAYMILSKEQLSGLLDSLFDEFFGSDNQNYFYEYREMMLSNHEFFTEYWETIGMDVFSYYIQSLQGNQSILPSLSVSDINASLTSLGELTYITTFLPDMADAIAEVPLISPGEPGQPPGGGPLPPDTPSDCPLPPANARFEGDFEWEKGDKLFQTDLVLFYYQITLHDSRDYEGELTIQNNTGQPVRVWFSRCPYGNPPNSSYQDSGDGYAAIAWSQSGRFSVSPFTDPTLEGPVIGPGPGSIPQAGQEGVEYRVFIGRDRKLFLCFENPSGGIVTITHQTHGTPAT